MVILLVLLLVGLMVLMPFFEIWALNQLFGLSIGWTIWNWLAVVILNLAMNGGNVGAGTKSN